MSRPLAPLRQKDIETGRNLEREAVLKWLRQQERRVWASVIADMIEDGEHLK